MDAWYAFSEFYLSLIAYYVLHMIFVIASDFVEAFNIPPLNIGIYVDKMAAIRALLMVIADLLEWAITQKGLGDPGSKNLEEAKDSLKSLKPASDHSPKWYRRLGSLLSFFAMLMCRIVYLWLIYKSDNKSLGVFITLCIEGFWFGVFQMSFFAVGPEFNALTSFGIHTMGNFIFFTQVILNKRAKKKPKINSLYRVRVHGWVVLITSVIALPIWIAFCVKYSYGDTHEFTELVKKLNKQLESVNVNSTEKIATKLAEKMGSSSGSAQTEAKALLKTEFGLKNASVTAGSSNNLVNVTAGSGSASNSTDPLKIKITGGSDQFKLLVDALKGLGLDGSKKITNSDDASKIVRKLANTDLLAKQEVKTAIQEMIREDFDLKSASGVSVSGTENVVVTISGTTGTGNQNGQATIKVNDQSITIQVKGNVKGLDSNKCKATAIAIALALLDKEVKKQISKGVEIALQNDTQPEVEINVQSAFSDTQANRIAWKLGSAFTRVSEIKVGSSTGPKLKLSLSLEPWNKPGNVSQDHVWSPFWLFIIGAFAEDFSVPGILPFAFLDPEKANLVNYLTPSFFMTGALMTVVLNDVFEVGGFAKDLKAYSKFKAWSEGDAPGWHALWLMNIPKYIAFFIAMFSVHGTYDSLRCIIQSRWRVLILTMTVVIPRAWLETSGYVGVANYAILASDTNDFDGFNFIAYHDVLAMFCRFVYGKFAVGYNWTRVSLGYCLPKFRPRHKGFGFGFWWWVGRTLSRAWADTVKDFKADIKCYL